MTHPLMWTLLFCGAAGARFESQDGTIRVVGMCSKVYKGAKCNESQYWFGYKVSQKEFLTWRNASWLALECGAPSKILLFPQQEFEVFLKGMRKTEGIHWHVFISEITDKFHLLLSVSQQKEDVTGWLIP